MNDTLSDAERLLASIRATLRPDSLESRMDAAVRCDSEVVRHLRRMLGVPVDRPNPSSLEADQAHGDQRRADQ